MTFVIVIESRLEFNGKIRVLHLICDVPFVFIL
jgi:hypothetical protein